MRVTSLLQQHTQELNGMRSVLLADCRSWEAKASESERRLQDAERRARDASVALAIVLYVAVLVGAYVVGRP